MDLSILDRTYDLGKAACHPKRKHYVFGYCEKCYDKHEKEIIEHIKTISVNKPETDKPPYERASCCPAKPLYRQGLCKECYTTYEEHKERKKQNTESRKYRRRGMTKEWFDTEVAKGCAICKTFDWGTQGPCVDHDHLCCEYGCAKCIRGVLCRKCNTMIGCAKDIPETLCNGAKYLELWHKNTCQNNQQIIVDSHQNYEISHQKCIETTYNMA